MPCHARLQRFFLVTTAAAAAAAAAAKPKPKPKPQPKPKPKQIKHVTRAQIQIQAHDMKIDMCTQHLDQKSCARVPFEHRMPNAMAPSQPHHLGIFSHQAAGVVCRSGSCVFNECQCHLPPTKQAHRRIHVSLSGDSSDRQVAQAPAGARRRVYGDQEA